MSNQLMEYIENLYNKEVVEFQDYLNIEYISNCDMNKVKQFIEIMYPKYIKVIEAVIDTLNY